MMHIEDIDAGLSSDEESTRWAAAEAAGELIAESPWDVWRLVLRHGGSANEDVRVAVATCILEHLLEHQFAAFFPLLEAEIRAGNHLLGDTFRRCWKFGDAEEASNAKKWDSLLREVRKLRFANR